MQINLGSTRLRVVPYGGVYVASARSTTAEHRVEASAAVEADVDSLRLQSTTPAQRQSLRAAPSSPHR